jgi:glucose/arabinose dehydrogenase
MAHAQSTDGARRTALGGRGTVPAMRWRRLGSLLVIAGVLATILGAPTARAALEAGQLRPLKILGGLASPIGVTNAGDGTNRLFVIQRAGTVRTVRTGLLSPTIFLDLSAWVLAGGERGLLGLAFHPDFRVNRQLFVMYTRRPDGALVLARLTANSDRLKVAPSTKRVLLTISHPTFGNHNGGALAFGDDGYLYVGTGDGGGSGDQLRNAQSKSTLLGKILRLDVDGRGAGPSDEYAIPSDNPYVGASGLDEIWARGLRNPWRLTFDRMTGSMYVGDVGQGRYEEIDRESPASTGGRNYGWPIWEGKHCYPGGTSCSSTGMFPPVADYAHVSDGTDNFSITGGYVYRGASYPDLLGLYVFADYCSGRIWTMPAGGSAITMRTQVDVRITSFGESEGGELYFVTLGGSLFRVTAPSS